MLSSELGLSNNMGANNKDVKEESMPNMEHKEVLKKVSKETNKEHHPDENPDDSDVHSFIKQDEEITTDNKQNKKRNL